MSDSELDLEMEPGIEHVAFLRGGGESSDKQTLYHPSSSQKVKQLVCSRRKSFIIAVFVCVFILTVALIAAFARPTCPVRNSPPTAQPTSAGIPAKPVQPTEPIATNGEVFPWKGVRLPDFIKPDSYHIELQPNMSTFTFSGSVSITLHITKSDNQFIVLHSRQLNITDKKLMWEKSEIKIIKLLEYTNHEQLYIKTSEELLPGRDYILKLSFEGILTDKLNGFYKSSYKNEKGEKRWLATTQFESTYARAAFPCFDEPELKANFSLSMIREKDHITLFNMPRKGAAEPGNENNLEIDHFETSVKMSTYLVAFVVCDYGKISSNSSDYTISVYAPRHLLPQANWALEVATQVLPYYEKFFGEPYPLPKQDLIAIPDFSAGAMENWGLITYRMVDLLYNPNVSSEHNKQRVAIVVAHELAHQWFGNLVTMKWWNDLWLNEGFASFLEVKGVGMVQPDWNMEYEYVKKVQEAMAADSVRNSHPIQADVDDPAEINSLFDDISYNKGSSLIRMLSSFIGETVLKDGLKKYLVKYKYGNAETADLWNQLSLAATDVGLKVKVKEVMDTWTSQMGYPVVSVHRLNGGNKVIANQQRFFRDSYKNHPKSFSYSNNKWIIPLTYIDEVHVRYNQSKTVWIEPHKQATPDFAVHGKWFKVNVHETMFYRVNYDDVNWKALIQLLNTNHTNLSDSDRSNLIDDAFALQRSGLLETPDYAYDLTKYLFAEKDYMPWSTALGWFSYTRLVLAEDLDVVDVYKKYELGLIKPMVKKLGWDDEGQHLTKFLRSLILERAVSLGDLDSIQNGTNYFNDWMNRNISIPLHLKSTVYRAGIENGNEIEWQYCWNKFKETHDPSELRALLKALTYTTDANRLMRLLEYSLDLDKIRSQDTVSVITNIAINPAGGVLAWNFVRQNWQELFNRYGSGSFDMNYLILDTTSHFSTETQYNEVQYFFNKVDVGPGKRAVKQTLEKIDVNRKWRKKYKNQVKVWLQRNV